MKEYIKKYNEYVFESDILNDLKTKIDFKYNVKLIKYNV